MFWERLLRTTNRQPAYVRWLLAAAFFGLSLTVRIAIDRVVYGLPFVTFIPAIIGATLLCGEIQAWTVLIVAVTVSSSMFMHAGGMPTRSGVVTILGSALVSAFIIIIVSALLNAVRTNHRLMREQETLFHELQHRVANTLQFVANMLIMSRKLAEQGKTADRALEDAANRVMAMGQLHRRMYDPSNYERGFEPLMREILEELFRGERVEIAVETNGVTLPLKQMTNVVLLVTEAATNSLKHVFRQGHGTRFEVVLAPVDVGRIRLTVRDDGPGLSALPAPDENGNGLGMRIMRGLADQLGSRLRWEESAGTIMWCEFNKI